jgi:hypothetical protein
MRVAEQYGLKTPNSGVFTTGEFPRGGRGSLHEKEPWTKFKNHIEVHSGHPSLNKLCPEQFFV